MTGAKLTCPNCEMMLVTPEPMAAGTLVTCPRCGTRFGVPALESKAPRAESVKAPAVLQARPVAPAQPGPRAPAVAAPVPPPAPRARPPRPQPAAVAPVTDSLNFEEPSFPSGDDLPAPEQTEPGARPREFKHRHKKKADPMVKWLLTGSGTVLLIAFVIVGIVMLSPEKKPHAKSPAKDANGPNSAGEEKKSALNESAGKPERRSAAPAHAANNPKAKAGATDKKDKSAGKMTGDNDSDAPIPIPGLGPSKSNQPPPPP